MKKTFIVILAIMVLLFTSCSKNKDNEKGVELTSSSTTSTKKDSQSDEIKEDTKENEKKNENGEHITKKESDKNIEKTTTTPMKKTDSTTASTQSTTKNTSQEKTKKQNVFFTYYDTFTNSEGTEMEFLHVRVNVSNGFWDVRIPQQAVNVKISETKITFVVKTDWEEEEYLYELDPSIGSIGAAEKKLKSVINTKLAGVPVWTGGDEKEYYYTVTDDLNEGMKYYHFCHADSVPAGYSFKYTVACSESYSFYGSIGMHTYVNCKRFDYQSYINSFDTELERNRAAKVYKDTFGWLDPIPARVLEKNGRTEGVYYDRAASDIVLRGDGLLIQN